MLPYGIVWGYQLHRQKGNTMELQDGTYFLNGNRLDPSSLERGYWVAETDHEFDHGATTEELIQIAQKMTDTYDVGYIGIWTDPQGRKVMDATHHVRDLMQAIAMGRHWEQKAIWDIKHGHAIYI